MLAVQVNIQVKLGSIDSFFEAVRTNIVNSFQALGIAPFDRVQNREDPSLFVEGSRISTKFETRFFEDIR